MQIHFLLNLKKLLVPYNKLSVVYVNIMNQILKQANLIFVLKHKKTSLSLNILNL